MLDKYFNKHSKTGFFCLFRSLHIYLSLRLEGERAEAMEEIPLLRTIQAVRQLRYPSVYLSVRLSVCRLGQNNRARSHLSTGVLSNLSAGLLPGSHCSRKNRRRFIKNIKAKTARLDS